jgi:hypothetical protein
MPRWLGQPFPSKQPSFLCLLAETPLTHIYTLATNFLCRSCIQDPVLVVLSTALSFSAIAPFHSLTRFEPAINGQTYFADVGIGGTESVRPGLQLEGYVSIDDLISRNGGGPVTVNK